MYIHTHSYTCTFFYRQYTGWIDITSLFLILRKGNRCWTGWSTVPHQNKDDVEKTTPDSLQKMPVGVDDPLGLVSTICF